MSIDTQDRTAILTALTTSPAFDPDEDNERLIGLCSLAYGGLEEYADALWVAGLLRHNGFPTLVVRLTADERGDVDGYVVGVATAGGELVVHRETGDLSGDPTATGWDAAVGYARSLLADHTEQVGRARLLGLPA